MSSTDNAKVSDSGYTNTYGNSQSQRSSGSSLSRNSNRSESSGYYGGHPSTFGFSNEALPRPISKKKDKEHEKKKLKTSLESSLETVQKCVDQQLIEPFRDSSGSTELSLNQPEKVGTVELVDATDPGEHNGHSNSTIPDEGLGKGTNSSVNDFCAVISLHDGLVLNSTVSLQTALGYPKDSWNGKSFIDYVDPKDRTVFVKKLAKSIILPFDDREGDLGKQTTGLFCRLRKYSVPNTSGNSSQNDSEPEQKRRKLNEDVDQSEYVRFYLTFGFKYLPDREDKEKTRMMLMTIAAKPVRSAYKAPEETIISPIFSTRHTATCHFSHVDDDIVQYFGFLPQNMIGRSLFDFYHPEDLPFIKDIYEIVIRLQGSLFRSKPYRFSVQNGGYIVLETEWSSFINPWTEKLEFVVGHHRVLRGPVNPDVFHPPDNSQHGVLANMGDEILKQSQIIQNEICALLKEKIETPVGITYDNSSDFMELVDNLKHEVKGPNLPSNIPTIAIDDESFSEHDSVMLGEISPHHEYCDSKSSSETPPSYNQLNYNEKIERFFNSKPLNDVCGSDEENMNSYAPSTHGTNKNSPNHTSPKLTEKNRGSGGSGSGENLSSGSNNRTSSTSRDSISGNFESVALDNLKLPTLTEDLLNKHNLDMEKLMVLKHKEKRMSIKNSKLNDDARIKNVTNNSAVPKKGTGVTWGWKRSSTHSHQDIAFKASKQDDGTRKPKTGDINCTIFNKPNPATSIMNIPPQIAVTVSNNIATASTSTHDVRPQTFPNMVPIYYLSVPRIPENIMLVSPHQVANQLSSGQNAQPSSFVPYGTPLARVLYPQMIETSTSTSMLYTPSMILGVPTVQKETPRNFQQTHPENFLEYKRPASQATSIKAEPGSIMAMSESSKKFLSPRGRFSSCVSADEVCSSLVDHQVSINTQSKQIESSMQDSSDSSFYGSFLDTSSDSSGNILSSNENHKVNVSRCREDVTMERRRFSMIKQLKANFELQKNLLRASSEQQRLIRGRSMTRSGKAQQGLLRMAPPWLQGVKMTHELIYQYQMNPRPLNDVLEADLVALRRLHQPLLVNDQLDQLYLDLELEGLSTKLNLEDSNPASIPDRDIENDVKDRLSPQQKNSRRHMKHSVLSMMFEENAPIPQH